MHSLSAVRRLRDFRLLLAGTTAGTLGMQMQTTAVGWELYERTHSALALGMVGLVALLPIVALTLPAGHAVDTLDRRSLLIAAQALFTVAWLGLAAVSWWHGPLWTLYGCVLLGGIARAFQGPLRSAILPSIVPSDLLATAITVQSADWQIAAVVGPAAAGMLIAATGSAAPVYLCAAAGALVFLVATTRLHYRQVDRPPSTLTLNALVAGVKFVVHARLILGALTLDLFAVLLGGATTLLPIYAKDILHVGAAGLGWMNAADSIGAIATAIWLGTRPPMRRAGRTLLFAVFGFGVATLVFGVSRSFALSMAALIVLGATDMVSVVVRQTLVPLVTPDDMRGRVGAVNSLFIGTSNQLGGFESGVVAQAFGPVASVVSGAIGTMLVVGLVAWHWPEIRRLGALSEVAIVPPETLVAD
ncbi:MAG TPA: MFS transporter [Gemmatimonadaceae bacterium]|nr:MFS transporter [Gemmatimonadaceae bacterium]